MMTNIQPGRRSVLIAVLVLALGQLGVASAAPPEATPRTPPPPAEKGAEPRCVHGCERWGKVCNVDPRGVYKCRRVCEKFGEICE